MEITLGFIDSFAPNAAAVTNGKKLVQKGSFLKLHISPDGSLIFGECAGSGKNPYQCSVDFIDKAKPVARCSCPSRQFPCKHCIGLMLARAGGAAFTETDIPEDVASKRVKMEKKAEKAAEPKAVTEDTPKKAAARQAAGRKKVDAQLEGLKIARQLLGNMVQMGLGTLDVPMRKTLSEQIKAPGNYYIPGVQTAFQDLLLSLEGTDEERFVHATEHLIYLHALIAKGFEYLPQKRESGIPDTETNIEELLGHGWKLEELREYGCVQTDVKLMQLSFQSYDDPAAKQEVQEGIWIDTGNGRLCKTRHYRPYRAAKHIKEEDTVFDMVTIPELFLYPGNLNPRVRWNESLFSSPETEIFAKIQGFAQKDYATVIKAVKNQLKNPMADKEPVALLYLRELGKVGEETVIMDENGVQMTLCDCPYGERKTVELLTASPMTVTDTALLALFHHDLSTGRLTAMPLALVSNDRIIRLLY